MKQVYTNHKRLPLVDFHHDFDLMEGKDCMLLTRSNDKTWKEEHRGVVAAQLNDDGNNITIRFEDQEPIELMYHQAEELFILLSQCKWDGIEIKESKTTMKWPSSL